MESHGLAWRQSRCTRTAREQAGVRACGLRQPRSERPFRPSQRGMAILDWFCARSVGTSRYSLPYGHPIRPFDELDVRPLPIDSGAGIVMVTSPPRLTRVNPGQVVYLDVIVKNETDQLIGCSRDNPLVLSYWWLDEDGRRFVEEPVRCYQSWRLAPHASCNLLCRARAPDESGTYSLVLGLVQEGVRWLDECNVTAGKWTVRPHRSCDPHSSG
jgi:hypothetical protein